jgi:prepilin-type processing-associated H-X9-DG protein
MAGDRNLTTNGVRLGPGRVKITRGSVLSWDINTQHKSQGNVCMGDGSVQQATNARLNEQWSNMGITNEPTLLFP